MRVIGVSATNWLGKKRVSWNLKDIFAVAPLIIFRLVRSVRFRMCDESNWKSAYSMVLKDKWNNISITNGWRRRTPSICNSFKTFRN